MDTKEGRVSQATIGKIVLSRIDNAGIEYRRKDVTLAYLRDQAEDQ